jgi:hypothetical protein
MHPHRSIRLHRVTPSRAWLVLRRADALSALAVKSFLTITTSH